jgi:xylulokinase
MYNDSRAQDQLARCKQDEVGLRPTATLARLAWLSAQYPKAHFVTSPDLALWYLAGEPLRVSDTSHWIKAGIDAETLEWPARSLESLEIDQAKLPKLSKPGRVVGTLAVYLANIWGLRHEVSLVLGMTDGCTSQIATGATQLGDSVGVLGTTLVLKAVWSEAVDVPQMGIYSHVAPDGSFWPGGGANTGAGAMPQYFPRHDPIALEHWGEQASAYGPSTYVSYSLPGVGERFPFVSATVESFATAEPADDVDRYRSFLEGVAFAERYGRQILGEAGVVFNRHFVSGGGSRSASWNRIRATVLGEPLYRASFGDSAIGAAFLAGFPTQRSKWADYIPKLIPAPLVVEPFERESNALESRYGQFLEEIERRGLN